MAIMTTHLAAPVECTESEAYKAPIVNMQIRELRPPVRVEVRRGHLSANKRAGIVVRKIKIEEMPEARKEEVVLLRPAWEKRMGA